MAEIKLFKIGILEDGTERFQSQLNLNSDTVDFIRRTDGIMRCYRHGENGFDFYPYEKPYVIVKTKQEMKYQEL